MNFTFIIPAAIGAYLLGSLPWAVWIGRIFYGTDVRSHGSGNAGATNTLRVLGNKAGLSVLFLDFMKGFAASSIAYLQDYIQPGETGFRNIQMILGAFAVMGHVYPVFAGFKGGKGIATLLGVTVAISWQVSVLCVVVFLVTVSLTRFISLGSMIACILSPLFAWVIYGKDEKIFIYFCITIAVMVLYTHRANIGRLRMGTESRFSFNKKNRN